MGILPLASGHGQDARDTHGQDAHATTEEPLIDAARPDSSRLRLFGLVLVALAFLRVLLGYVALPVGLTPAASILSTVVFMVLPMVALFLGAGHRWDIKQAIAIVVLGVVVQIGGAQLAQMAVKPAVGGVIFAASQAGLVVWCMGAGAALACLLKDRNMLLPIAVFLALFDTWLVFAPEGLVSKALSGAPTPIKLDKIAYAVPQVATVGAPPTNGLVRTLAFVGPADLLFLAMFFVALYRFGMRPRATLVAIAPVLVVYLGIVLLLPDVWLGPIRLAALPALLPIGLTVLWVNRKEFKLLPDERAITLGLVLLGVPFVAWRILATQPEPVGRGPLGHRAPGEPPKAQRP